jgi:hypothetical protein
VFINYFSFISLNRLVLPYILSVLVELRWSEDARTALEKKIFGFIGCMLWVFFFFHIFLSCWGRPLDMGPKYSFKLSPLSCKKISLLFFVLLVFVMDRQCGLRRYFFLNSEGKFDLNQKTLRACGLSKKLISRLDLSFKLELSGNA